MKPITLALVLSLFMTTVPAQATVTLDWVTVGNPGNANDTTGYGGVGYSYRISKYEVTNAQYTEFLNNAAASDSNGLYNTNMASDANSGIVRAGTSGSYTYSVMTGFENKPVTFTGFLDAMRFTNWMQNGQGNGNTESGVYDLSGGGLVARTSSPSIQFWIPTENEWYKAAYYNPTLNSGAGGYYLYPTQSNTAPTSGSAITGQANMANFGSTAGGLTNVGSYDNSASFYGTFDQGGNLWEWNEAINGTDRVMRGGAWDYPASTLLSTTRSSSLPNTEGDRIGFRLAMLESVPEPSRLLLMALGAALGLLRRRRAAA